MQLTPSERREMRKMLGRLEAKQASVPAQKWGALRPKGLPRSSQLPGVRKGAA